MGLHSELENVLEVFRAVTLPSGGNLRAFADSGKVDPPCVWIPTPSIEFNFSKRILTVAWEAFLVAPAQSLASVSPTLSELVDAVAGLFPFTEGTPQPLTLPGGGPPVPAYQLTWSSRSQIGA